MKPKAISLFAALLFAVSVCGQSMYQHTIDTAIFSHLFSVLDQHHGEWRGITMFKPDKYVGQPVSLTEHVILPQYGTFSEEAVCSPVVEKKIFLYQKGDSILATVGTTSFFNDSAPALYSSSVLFVKGRITLITTWTTGFPFYSTDWRMHQWSQASFTTKTVRKTTFELKNSLPNSYQHEAVKAIEANINLALSAPLDSSETVSKRLYAILDQEYAKKVPMPIDPDDIKITSGRPLDFIQLKIDGLHKTWTMVHEILLKEPFLKGENLGLYSNPEFDKDRDNLKTEITNRDEKIVKLALF